MPVKLFIRMNEKEQLNAVNRIRRDYLESRLENGFIDSRSTDRGCAFFVPETDGEELLSQRRFNSTRYCSVLAALEKIRLSQQKESRLQLLSNRSKPKATSLHFRRPKSSGGNTKSSTKMSESTRREKLGVKTTQEYQREAMKDEYDDILAHSQGVADRLASKIKAYQPETERRKQREYEMQKRKRLQEAQKLDRILPTVADRLSTRYDSDSARESSSITRVHFENDVAFRLAERFRQEERFSKQSSLKA
eukprot:ANDGO_03721.mRNA.1 hypothetical protein